jgi:hypothetical protein
MIKKIKKQELILMNIGEQIFNKLSNYILE